MGRGLKVGERGGASTFTRQIKRTVREEREKKNHVCDLFYNMLSTLHTVNAY